MLSPTIYMNIYEDLLRNRAFIFKLAVLDSNFINFEPFRRAIDFIFPHNKESDHQDHKDRKNFLLDIAIKNNEADNYVVYHFERNDEILKTEKAKRQEELAVKKNISSHKLTS